MSDSVEQITDETVNDLWDILSDGIATLDCGCVVEPDGTCPCGNSSPLLEMGLI